MNPGDSIRVSFEEEALAKAVAALRTTASGAIRKAKDLQDPDLERMATDIYHTARMMGDSIRKVRQ